MQPRVTIGMPVYNGEKYVAEAIESILRQTFADFELIISDNASTDSTPTICAAYAASDSRVRYYHNARNLGAAANYRRAFALRRGELFRFAAYDDRLAPTNLERCVEILDREPTVVLAYPRLVVLDADGREIAHKRDTLHVRMERPSDRFRTYVDAIDAESMCDPIFGLVRSSTLAQTPVHDSYIAADMIMLGELSLHGQIHEVPEELFYERLHAEGSVQANPTLDDRAAWFDPANRSHFMNQVPHWRWLFELSRAIQRVPLSTLERRRCYAVLGRWIWTRKRGILTDAVRAARTLFAMSAKRCGVSSPPG